MLGKNNLPQLIYKFLCGAIFVSIIFSSNSSYATYDGIRNAADPKKCSKENLVKSGTSGNCYTVSYDVSKNRCDTGEFKFDPIGPNPDVNWELTNPVCISYILAVGAAAVQAQVIADNLCNAAVFNAALLAEIATGVPMSPAMIKAQIACTTYCSVQMSACIASGGAACTTATACCAAQAASYSSYGISVAALAAIYAAAKNAYEEARVCGHDWYTWEKRKKDETGIEIVVPENDDEGKWIKTKGPYRKCLDKLFLDLDSVGASSDCGTDNKRDVKNKAYREFIYGGKEFNDDACSNPWDSKKQNEILGYSDSKQRYYMTGAGNASVYACHRFITSDLNDESARSAYECCKKRSQNTVCIENKVTPGSDAGHKFCEVGGRCNVAGVWFDAYESREKPNYVCAKTYSVCPYNHLLAGGTERADYNPNDPSQMVNFCQYMNHCAKVPVLPYVRSSEIENDFISSSCRDLKGDSQNVYGYTSQLIPINTRGFSAPLVQCFKESMENVFLNKAGYTKCRDVSEIASPKGICASGNYAFKQGESFADKSFFIKIQDNLRTVIKLILTLSVIGFGVATLLAVPGTYIERKVILSYVVKIGLVVFFTLGTAWQQGFMTGVLDISSFMANLTFRVDDSKPLNQLDGCQFPRFNYNDSNEDTKYNIPSYPPGKSYLRIWDTLDCKIALALGFGPEVSVPNLIFMILGGFFTGGLGIVFFLAAFVFAFFLITIVMRAMHIFLMSITSVILLIYLSPIIIPLSLFEKTKNVFNGWWKQIVGFTLQPMILFAYLGILITIFDHVVVADATFTPQQIVRSGVAIEDTNGRQVPKLINCSGAASDSSIYCIFRISDIKTFTGFEPLGIGLPMLGSMTAKKMETIFKAAFLMFIFSCFMDKITSFAAKLVGGAELKSDWGLKIAAAYRSLRGIQIRGMRGIIKNTPRVGISVGVSKSQSSGSKKDSSDQEKGQTNTADQEETGKSHTTEDVGRNEASKSHVGGKN